MGIYRMFNFLAKPIFFPLTNLTCIKRSFLKNNKHVFSVLYIIQKLNIEVIFLHFV